jgi:hypothetical protein
MVAIKQVAYSKYPKGTSHGHTNRTYIAGLLLRAQRYYLHRFNPSSNAGRHYDCMDAGGSATQEAKAETSSVNLMLALFKEAGLVLLEYPGKRQSSLKHIQPYWPVRFGAHPV